MIDWVTVVAQIVNFIILVVLLKVFLYGRVLKAMDERRDRIRESFEEASRKASQADERAEEFARKERDIDEQRERLLQEARQDAQRLLGERRDEAERDVERQRRQWLESLREERRDFLAELRRQAARRLGELAGKVLADLADARLQERVVAAFLRRLGEADEEQRAALQEALANREGPVEVAAAFEMPQEQEGEIRQAIQGLVQGMPQSPRGELEIGFVRAEELVCGVQLRFGGRAVGWNVAEYAFELAQEIDGAMEERIRELAEPPPAAAPGEAEHGG